MDRNKPYLTVILITLVDFSGAGVVVGRTDNELRPVSDVPRKTPEVRLPQLLPVFIRYAYAKYWNDYEVDGACTAAERQQIADCGILKLANVIAGGSQRKADDNPPAGDFNRALDDLCSEYYEFKRCLTDRALDDCDAEDKSLVDTFYSYLCGEGKQELQTNSTGTCLSTLKYSSVINSVKYDVQCQNTWTDLSSSVEVMFSIYHDHDTPTAKRQGPAIRQMLTVLCRVWHQLEMCIFPAYGRLCGTSAKSFYTGLVRTLKLNLQANFLPYGSEVAELAACNRATAARISRATLNTPATDSFSSYLRKEYRVFVTVAKEDSLKYGRCSSVATTSRLNMCFWEVAKDFGPELLDGSDRQTERQQILKGFHLFTDCYDAGVVSCPKDTTIELGNVLEAARQLLNITDFLYECMQATSLFVHAEQQCGGTFSDITNYYVYKAFMLFASAHKSCAAGFHVTTFPDLTCFKASVSSLSSQAPPTGLQAACSGEILPRLNRFIEVLEDTLKQVAAVFEEAFKITCAERH